MARATDDDPDTATKPEPKFETTKPSANTLVVKSEDEKKQER